MKLYPNKLYLFVFVFVLFISISILIYYINISNKIEISAEEARENNRKGRYDYIVDVRTDQEWSKHHLSNTIHIPIGTLVTELPQKIPNRNARILFICKKGIRASAVTVIANKLGYNNIHAMTGNYKQLLP